MIQPGNPEGGELYQGGLTHHHDVIARNGAHLEAFVTVVADMNRGRSDLHRVLGRTSVPPAVVAVARFSVDARNADQLRDAATKVHQSASGWPLDEEGDAVNILARDSRSGGEITGRLLHVDEVAMEVMDACRAGGDVARILESFPPGVSVLSSVSDATFGTIIREADGLAGRGPLAR